MNPALARAHVEGQDRLRTIVRNAVAAAWAGLPGYDEENVDEFVALAVPAVLAGQRLSAALVDVFVARAMGRQPLGIPADAVTGAAVRNGAPPEQVYRRPFVTVWTALSKGVEYEAAVGSGLARASTLGATDVQLTQRATMQAVQDRDPRIRGYRRITNGGACTYCQQISGAFVRSAQAMPLHPGCGCGLTPVEETEQASPLPEGLAVHQHGELGAYLGSSDHHFSEL